MPRFSQVQNESKVRGSEPCNQRIVVVVVVVVALSFRAVWLDFIVFTAVTLIDWLMEEVDGLVLLGVTVILNTKIGDVEFESLRAPADSRL